MTFNLRRSTASSGGNDPRISALVAQVSDIASQVALPESMVRLTGGGAATDINNAISELLQKNPLVTGVFGGQGSNTTGGRHVSGGGTVIVDGGLWDGNEEIELPPRVTLRFKDAELKASSAVTMIKAKGSDGLFSRHGCSVVGEGQCNINGNGIALDGIDMTLVTTGTVENVYVHNCTGDGVKSLQGQWCGLFKVISVGNGGWGINLNNDPNTSATFGTNDFTNIGCKVEENALGGLLIGQAGTSTWIGLTAQYHENGPGIRIKPATTASGCYGITFTGTHFESNKVHAEVLSTGTQTPVGTSFDGGHWIKTDGAGTGSGVAEYNCERFIINEGINTSVDGGGSFNAPALFVDEPATGGGMSNALFEQSSSKGSLSIDNFISHRGTGEIIPYACDENGVVYDDNKPSPVFRVLSMGQDDNGSAPFGTGGWFGPARHRKHGDSTQRPTLTADDAGFLYMQSGKPIFWTGADWVDATEAVV